MKRFRLLTILCLVLIMALGFGIGTTTYFVAPKDTAYAATEPEDTGRPLFRVMFYIGDVFYTQYTLNQGQKVTKPVKRNAADTIGLNASANTFKWFKDGVEWNFDTQTVGTADITLKLDTGSNKVVFFMVENEDYDPSVTIANKDYLMKKDEYRVSFITLVTSGGQIAKPDTTKEPSKVGYTFSHWGSTANGSEYNYALSVESNISLYANFTRNSYKVQFLTNGILFNEQMVNHGSKAVDPGVPTLSGQIFSHWYVTGDINKTAFDIVERSIEQAYVLVAEFTSAELTVTVNSFVYGNISDSAGNALAELPPAVSGSNYTFYIMLNNNYNEYAFSRSNVTLTENAYVSFQVKHPDGSPVGLYEILIRTVSGDITVNISGVTINKYDVTITSIAGLDMTVLSSDYTNTGNVYTLDFLSAFTFKLAINANYEKVEGSTITVSNCTYDEITQTYTLDTDNADKTIIIGGDVREVVSITLVGVEDLTIIMSTYDDIISYDEDNFFYRVEKGKSIVFEAIEKEGYSIKTVVNADKTAVGYRVNANEEKEVTFTVVPITSIKVPASIVGVTTYSGSNMISNSYDIDSRMNIFVMQVGTDLTLNFIMKAEYTQAVLEILSDMGNVVDVDGFPQVVIKDIRDVTTLTITEPTKNRYTATLTNNAMVQLSDAAGAGRVTHGESLVINIQKLPAYSNAAITPDNVTILGPYTGYAIANDYSTMTISGVTGAITVYIENLVKNKYSVTLNSSDVYGTLTSTNALIEYDGSFTFLVSLKEPYSKTIITRDIFNITSNASGLSVGNDVTISTSTVVISNITESLTVSIKDLNLNTYKMRLPASVSGQYSVLCSNDTITYGQDFVFTITLERAYTKNAETMSVTRKIGASAVEVQPTIAGAVLTYTVPNITNEYTFSVSTLTPNIYTVEFYDSDPVELKSSQRVQDGKTLLTIPDIQKEGSTFNYWAYDLAGTLQVNFSNAIYEDFVCYAIFSTQRFTVTFIDYQGSRTVPVYYGKRCEALEIREKTGWDVSYWEVEDGYNLNSVKDDFTVTAIYIQNTYVVLFKNGDTIHSRQLILHGNGATAPENPSRRGHTFVRWNRNFDNITQDTTIEAIFDVIPYTVYFYNASNSNTLMLNYQVNYGQPIIEPQQHATERSKYKFRYTDLEDSSIIYDIDKTLEDGYVLEGWYADEHLSLRYNFDEPVTKDVHIYGNLKLTKMLVTFYVDGKFYTEKSVDYKGDLINVPAVPRKVGYDQVAPQWVIRGGRTDYNYVTTDLAVDAVYQINKYTIKFVFPGGKEQYTRTITHGGTIPNIPLPATRFGEIVIYNRDAARYVTQDATVYITVIDLMPYLTGAGAAGALGLVVLFMAIGISALKHSHQDTKKMEQLIKDIRDQDKRLTEINERRLKAQVDAEMQRKERINKNRFL